MEHTGNAIACVGAGPSLTVGQLNYLWKQRVPTVSSGRIHTIFNQTDWRPEAVILGESDNKKDIIADIKIYLDEGVYVWLRDTLATPLSKGDFGEKFPWYNYQKIAVFPHCGHLWVPPGEPGRTYKPNGWHKNYICSYTTSGWMAVQWAVKMGYTHLALVGYDNEYSVDKPYVTDDYLHFRRAPSVALMLNQWLADSAEWVKDNIEATIINCTPGGALDQFPRERLGDLM